MENKTQLVSEDTYKILKELTDKHVELPEDVRAEGAGALSEHVIAALEEIQARYRYLPEHAMRQVAARLGVPLAQVYHVATFYTCFRLQPMGRHHIRVCHGTACHVRGSVGIQEEINRRTGVESGQTTKDGRFTLDAVNCLGCCALAPVVVVDEDYYHMTKSKIEKTLEKYA